MDETTIFEHQVADEIRRIVGPSRPIDDLTLMATAIAGASRSPGWRLPILSRTARLLVAAAIVVVVGGAWMVMVPRGPAAPAVGGPASSPEASTPSSSPDHTGTAAAFIRPFRYTIPDAMASPATEEDGSRFSVVVLGAASSRDALGKVQAEASLNDSRGVLVARVTDAAVGNCPAVDGGAAYAHVSPGPAAFVADLQALAGLRLEGTTETTLDGRPALAAGTVWGRCGSSEILVGTAPIWNAFVRLDIPSRLVVADVGGETIMVQAWAGTPDALEAWLPVAQGFIDSMRFLDERDVAPGSPPRTSSPA
jgi:hypothetical protein